MYRRFVLIFLTCLLAFQAHAAGLVLNSYAYRDLNNVLLLHFNGADASTTFTDSATAKTITANGNAQIDTGQSVFGGASGLYDGAGDYLSAASSSDFDFGSGDFTIDLRVRPNGLSAHHGLVSLSNSALTQGGFFLEFDSGGSPSTPLRMYTMYTDGTVDDIHASVAFSTGTWYHIAVVRNGTNFAMYVDGTQRATWTSSKTLRDAPNGLVSGRIYTDSNAHYFDGWMDELRVSKGIARWTSGFTPPSAEY
ncbi:MAG: LamG domain-containing protein [Alphaproteobacteria bacterium]